jgi:cyclopropane fatty-acyl-phospholipid synthase-like methyltransferase
MVNNIKDSWYHSDWQNARLKFILSKYSSDFFKGKRILELGACNGYFSAYFQSIGAETLAVEGRMENIQKIKEYYPELNVKQSDLDTDDWQWGKWDMIVNFGLYYHLDKYHIKHLENCLDNSEIMLFETVVYDSNKSELYFRDESGYDQSLTNRGGNPTTSFVEDIFKSKGKEYEIFKTNELNGNGHFYDWEDTGNNIFHQNQRRFWIVN